MKRYFLLLCTLLSSLISGMEISERLAQLGDKIYCIAETNGNQKAVKKELKQAVKDIKKYLKSHQDIDKSLLQKAFFEAAGVGNKKIIKLLIKAGCAVNEKDEKGITPAMVAALYGNVATLQALLDAGADVTAQCDNSVSVEEYASLVMEHGRNDIFTFIPTVLSALCRYRDGDPFQACLALIQEKKKEMNSNES